MGVPRLEDYDGDVQSYQQDVDDYFADEPEEQDTDCHCGHPDCGAC